MKKSNPVKNIIGYIPVLTIAIGLIAGWVKISMSSEDAKAKISELKSDVKEIATEGDKEIKDLKEKDGKLEKAIEVAQVKQEEINKKVEQIDAKTDKIVDLLLEIRQKKK